MKKQEKKYQSPEDAQLKEAVFEAVKQWCRNDTNRKRGAMVMLTDDKGTHYMYVGNKTKNLKAAYDLLSSNDFVKAGRAVQITFEMASCLTHIDRVLDKAGIDPTQAKDNKELQAMYEQVPEYEKIMKTIQRLNTELTEIWQGK